MVSFCARRTTILAFLVEEDPYQPPWLWAQSQSSWGAPCSPREQLHLLKESKYCRCCTRGSAAPVIKVGTLRDQREHPSAQWWLLQELESPVRQFQETFRVHLVLWNLFNSYIATAGFRAIEESTIFVVSPSATFFDRAKINKVFNGESFVQVWKYFFHTCRLCSLLFLELSDHTGTCDTLRICTTTSDFSP